MTTERHSTWAIVVWLIVFFPVAIWMLIDNDRPAPEADDQDGRP
jgi:hypothetical protein